mgnify:CR=1 FL=1
MSNADKNLLIGIVGPCGSGKSSLVAKLEARGYRCRHIAQEHSYVKYMWQRITNPDILIFLQCSFENSTSRRKLNWQIADYEEQLRRLSHACLLYTSDAADERSSVDLGGRRIIKKKTQMT